MINYTIILMWSTDITYFPKYKKNNINQMLKILNLNKQTNCWKLKEHLNSFTKLVTFQSSIIRVYLNLCVHQFLVSFFEKQHLYSPMICLADWPIVVHFVVLSFLCHIWTYYCRLSPGTSWLFVNIVFLQFDSQSPSLSSNDSFSILINFFNYFKFSFISFIGCTGFLHLFVCLFVLLCIFFVVLLFVSSCP